MPSPKPTVRLRDSRGSGKREKGPFPQNQWVKWYLVDCLPPGIPVYPDCYAMKIVCLRSSVVVKLLLVLLPGFLLTTCTNVDPVPAATQQGRNIFACKVNGKTWIPNGGPGFMGLRPLTGGFHYVYNKNGPGKHLGVKIGAHMKNGEYINLYLQRSAVGKYQLNQQTQISPFTLFPENYGAFHSDGYFVTNAQATGEITITKSDTVKLLIAGTFRFRAMKGSGSSAKTVEITDGRFDINMNTLK